MNGNVAFDLFNEVDRAGGAEADEDEEATAWTFGAGGVKADEEGEEAA